MVRDSASELAAGPIWNSAANSGSSGCTQYSREKVEKPARNNAKEIRRYSGEPRETPSGNGLAAG